MVACSSGGQGGATPEASPTAEARSTAEAPGASASTSTTAPAPHYGGHRSDVYADPAHWLCRADTDDPCDSNMSTTVVQADGSMSVESFEPAKSAPVDCFYVYPTTSRDPTPNSDLVPGPEEMASVRSQAARLGKHCRVFAPVYPQVTVAALTSRLAGTPVVGGEDSGRIAYEGVADAWKHYIDNDNQGRGVVLVGHSQGASVLNTLIKREIDGNEVLRKRLVSALLLGSSVRVPEGKDVGGDFANIPLCRAPDQTGCAISYVSFRATSPPPPDSLFGRTTAQGPVGCTNPAALQGGSAELQPYFSASGRSDWVRGQTVSTPFVSTPGLVTGECVTAGGFTYLQLNVNADPADPRTDDIPGNLTPAWGMHLIDVHVAMGDLVKVVGSQAAAFSRRPPTAR